MTHQSTSLLDTYENDNETFKALTIHFVQDQIDYDCSIISLIVSMLWTMLALKLIVNFDKQHELLISQSSFFLFLNQIGQSVHINCELLNKAGDKSLIDS